jgi:hypothetical protein
LIEVALDEIAVSGRDLLQIRGTLDPGGKRARRGPEACPGGGFLSLAPDFFSKRLAFFQGLSFDFQVLPALGLLKLRSVEALEFSRAERSGGRLALPQDGVA